VYPSLPCHIGSVQERLNLPIDPFRRCSVGISDAFADLRKAIRDRRYQKLENQRR